MMTPLALHRTHSTSHRFNLLNRCNWISLSCNRVALVLVLLVTFNCSSFAKPFYTEELPVYTFTCEAAENETGTYDELRLALASARGADADTNWEEPVSAGELVAAEGIPSVDARVGGVRPQDEVYVISTRRIGCTCDPDVLASGLECRRFTATDECCYQWLHTDLMSVLSEHDPTTSTIFYVHGNRVSSGQAMQRCLTVYRRMMCCADSEQPIRFIALSWPSAQIPGPLKDVRVKAARTRPVGCQMAWVLDQIPGDVPLGLVGYSYGARVITGALHILGGGHLNGLCLHERVHPDRSPTRVVLIAAASHAYWLGPGRYHGMALSQVESMVCINNSCDRVMRWYHLSTTNGKPRAMGLTGPTCLGPEAYKVANRNVCCYCGANHDICCYLSTPGTACQIWDTGSR